MQLGGRSISTSCAGCAEIFGDILLGASCVARGGACLPTCRSVDPKWRFTGEVIVAITRLSDSINTPNDDITR
jgi:hypothetical protein